MLETTANMPMNPQPPHNEGRCQTTYSVQHYVRIEVECLEDLIEQNLKLDHVAI
jgi:hypothetical protein